MKRIHSTPACRRTFRRRRWQHRRSPIHLGAHRPSFLAAERTVAPARETA